jgi:hypothetical protein
MAAEYNVEAYLPSTIKRKRELAKLGLKLYPEPTAAEKAADLERFSYKAGGGGLRRPPKIKPTT